jgi:REP element-mobilizing transposase RayT
MEKFRNKFRIPSARFQGHSYNYGAYFITICTQNRIPYFGEIIQGQMHLSELGKVVQQEWLKTFEIRVDMNLTMDAFVVMPNHFHAVLWVGENGYNSTTTQNADMNRDDCRDAMRGVSGYDKEDAMRGASGYDKEDAMRGASGSGVSGYDKEDAMRGASGSGVSGYDKEDATRGASGSGVSGYDKEDATHGVSTAGAGAAGAQCKNLASIVRGFKSAVTLFARKNDLDFNWQTRFHDHIIRSDTAYQRIVRYIQDNPMNWKSDTFYPS